MGCPRYLGLCLFAWSTSCLLTFFFRSQASEGSGIHRPNANEEALMYSEQVSELNHVKAQLLLAILSQGTTLVCGSDDYKPASH